jgi:hypothetical protein
MASAKGVGRSSGPSGPMSLSDMDAMMSDQDRERESRRSFDPDRITQDDIMGLTEGYTSAPTPGDLNARDPVSGLTKGEREQMGREFYGEMFGGDERSLQGPIGNLGMEPSYYGGAPDVGIGPPANAGIESRAFSPQENQAFGFAPGFGTNGPLSALDAFSLGAAEESREAARSRNQQRNAAQYGYNAQVDQAIADTTRALGQPAVGAYAQPAMATNPFGEAFASDPFGAPSYSRVASFAQRDLDPNFSMAANPVSNVANALATPNPASRFGFAGPGLSAMANNMAPPSPVANPNRSRVAQALAAPAARAPSVMGYSSRAYSGVQPAVVGRYSYGVNNNPFGENFSQNPFGGPGVGSAAASGFNGAGFSGTEGFGPSGGGRGFSDDRSDSDGGPGGGGIGGGVGGTSGGSW